MPHKANEKVIQNIAKLWYSKSTLYHVSWKGTVCVKGADLKIGFISTVKVRMEQTQKHIIQKEDSL